jgi:hypothetical protein
MAAYSVEEEGGVQMRESSSTNPRLPPLGRILNTVLSASPGELEALLSQRTRHLQRGALDESVTALGKHAKEIVNRNESLDQMLLPLLQHVVKFKGMKNRKKVVLLLQCLSRNEDTFTVLADGLEKILVENDDHHIVLGWCIVVRELIEKGAMAGELFDAGAQHRYVDKLFLICCRCIHRLLSIVHGGSVEQDGFLLPTRLSIAAADCILIYTQALTEEESFLKAVTSKKVEADKDNRQLVTPINISDNSEGHFGKDLPTTSGRGPLSIERETLLWDQLDNLVTLVQRLRMWSKRSRPLHAKGLEQVSKRLQGMRTYRDSLGDKSDVSESEMKIGAAVLSACWKHYAKLMLLEVRSSSHQFKGTLMQFMAALQHYTQNDYQEEDPKKKRNGLETRTFFLACMALLLGRLDSDNFETAVAEVGSQFLNLLFAQLHHTDEDLTDMAVNILRAIIFRSPIGISGNAQSGFAGMETVIPLLIELLDERDSAARAVVLLIAEYFAINPDAEGIRELFARLDSDNNTTRRNALDVISELMAVCSESGHVLAPSLRQNIGKHLLDRLGDEELTNRLQASKLFAQLDPSFVMPTLVRLVYSRDVRVRSAASDAIVSVLRGQTDPCNVISVLLDCVRNNVQNASLPKHPGQVGESIKYSGSTTSHSGSGMDVDRIMRLVPKWSPTVQDWDSLVKMLLSKMFAETSNAVIPRFLSEISNHLADVTHTVFKLLISHMQKQKQGNEDIVSKWKEGRLSECEDTRIEDILFDRLSPLLVLRVLPLRAFNDLNSMELYGEFSTIAVRNGDTVVTAADEKCITGLLINRMCHLFEFEDVRKLAAELTGRLHPQVMLPLIGSHLEHATVNRDILKLKACLFSICNSLMIRDKESALHPVMFKVRHLITTVLLWPSLESDEVTKAQHGCIDCLALMICAELQISDSSSQSSKANMVQNESKFIEEVMDRPEHPSFLSNVQDTVISSVVRSLTSQQQSFPFVMSEKLVFHSKIQEDYKKTCLPISFRLCMANVLISVCQKISLRQKSLLPNVAPSSFIDFVLSALIDFVQGSDESQMRAACLQVIFTAVYHLKSSILPYANDLLNLSIGALRSKGLAEERIAGAKLLASLMGSEEAIVSSIAPNLMEARIVLTNISLMDTSPELRNLCEKLLECMSTPIDTSQMPKV